MNEGVKESALRGINENLCVIESNIIIKNSIFKENLNFSNVLFNGSVEFEGTNFSNSANFNGANFKNSANFDGTNFSNFANFNGTNFNRSVNFSYANFDGNTYFKNATFLGPANFNKTNFYNYAGFYYAKFNNSADFVGAKFHGDTSFWEADFNSSTNFSSAEFKNSYTSFQNANFNSDVNFLSANFNGKTEFKEANFSTITHFCNMKINSSVYFAGPETSENIITDPKTRHIFVKYYTEEARDKDAENIYYNFRKHEQDNKILTDSSKWTDFAGFISWGYGLKPWYTLIISCLIIIVCAFIYMNPSDLKNPGIYRSSEATSENKTRVTFWEALYFSTNIFTRLGSEDWHQRDSFRILVTIEAVLGWLLLALLLATISALPRI